MENSIQKKLLRVRPPRVKIGYDVETGGAIEKKELPFITGIIADLSGERDPSDQIPELQKRAFVDVNRDNFTDLMRTINPQVNLEPITNTLTGVLSFASLEEMEPLNIVKKIPALNDLHTERMNLFAQQPQAAGTV